MSQRPFNFLDKGNLLRKLLLTTVCNLHCHFLTMPFGIIYLMGKTQHSSIRLKTVYISCLEYFEPLLEFS